MAIPQWNTSAFGCLIRDAASFTSLMRTQLSASLPAPFLSKKADTSAPVELAFAIEVDNEGFGAFEQWWTFDLYDGTLPFSMFVPWGPQQPNLRCRFVEPWRASRIDSLRWTISGRVEIEREGLPRFSGGAR